MKVSASFFCGTTYASREIRCNQIAERLGCPVNVELDISNLPKHLVFVKSLPSEDELKKLIEHNVTIWVDLIDSDQGLSVGTLSDKIKFIAIGETAKRYISARVMNDVVVVPEHHCNFDRIQTLKHMQELFTVGFIGYKENFCVDPGYFDDKLREIGCRFLAMFVNEETTRQDVVDFYGVIDAQVTFRIPRIIANMPPEMKNPLKVINAASFGLATVGYPECSYDEFPLMFPAKTPEDLVMQCHRLSKTSPFYKTELLQKAEEYHIDNIIACYEEVLS